jgi:hypothetical protein
MIRPAGLVFVVGVAVILAFSFACGSGGSSSTTGSNSSTSGVSGSTGGGTTGGTGSSGGGSAGATAPVTYSFVAILTLENTSFSQVIGDTTDAPFLNSLINYQGSNPSAPGALATNYFADAHPSFGNYFMMTTGQLVTTDDTFNNTSAG